MMQTDYHVNAICEPLGISSTSIVEEINEHLFCGNPIGLFDPFFIHFVLIDVHSLFGPVGVPGDKFLVGKLTRGFSG